MALSFLKHFLQKHAQKHNNIFLQMDDSQFVNLNVCNTFLITANAININRAKNEGKQL